MCIVTVYDETESFYLIYWVDVKIIYVYCTFLLFTQILAFLTLVVQYYIKNEVTRSFACSVFIY